MSTPTSDPAFEREKWEAEKVFRERELAIQELELGIKSREQDTKEAEIELKKNEDARSRWSNPLVVAFAAAAVAALATLFVALLNGKYAREVEDQRAEEARILEVIKTGNPDKAAENLTFLLNAGLINDPSTKPKIEAFLHSRQKGSGPFLPSPVADTFEVVSCSPDEVPDSSGWDCVPKSQTIHRKKPSAPASSPSASAP
jgi:hypothetical protein